MITRPPNTLKSGQYVRHSKYGWGTIMECSRAEMLVYFSTIGVKRLATDTTFTVVGVGGNQKKSVA